VNLSVTKRRNESGARESFQLLINTPDIVITAVVWTRSELLASKIHPSKERQGYIRQQREKENEQRSLI
jgi:hypothetical protein